MQDQDLIDDAATRAARYLAQIADRRVAPDAEALLRMKELSRPLQAEPMDASAVLAGLDSLGSPATVASAGGRYFGFVTGGALPAGDDGAGHRAQHRAVLRIAAAMRDP